MILTKDNVSQFPAWKKSISETGAVLLINKDLDWTSFDVVAKVRNMTKAKKVGHAGTLDPLATGLLILCLGKATKTIEQYQGMPKTYSGTIKLGATTKTDDSEAEEENICDASNVSLETVVETANKLSGQLAQIPPMFSAKKVKGQKLYELARKDKTVELTPSQIEVYKFDIVKFENPFITFRIECSKGTYIRALARDMGQMIGTGAYLASLHRDAIGELHSDKALTVREFQELATSIEHNESL